MLPKIYINLQIFQIKFPLLCNIIRMAESHQIGESGQPKEKEASENSTESPTATSPLLKSQQGKNNHSSHRNATDESVSFVEDKDDDLCEKPPPPDTKNMVYLILLLHGIGVLLPWNTFLTIGYDYFISYKLNPNISDTSGNLPQTPLQNIFINSLTFCAQIPNLALNLLNLFVVLSGGLHRRIYVSLITIAAVCVITIAFVFVNTENWQLGFFIFTMATIVVLNSANGIYQNSIWGLVADFPGRFTNAIVLGNNLCGIMMAVLYILILLFNTQITINASIFFSLALLTVISCMVTFHFLPTFPFYKYYVSKAAKARQPEGTDILHEAQDVEGESEQFTRNTHPSLATYISVLKECWRALFNIWIIFFVTLSIFPAILLDIKLYPQGRKFDLFTYFGDLKVAEQLFRQFSIFLNFNLFATIGSSIANFVQWPSAKYLSVPAVFRLLFIPLFWACNYNPEVVNGRSVVLFKNEWFFVTLTTLMALSHGYWSSLSMMYAPQQVQQSKSQIVGMMSGFFLVFGIAVGIAFTFIEPHIVNLLGLLYHSF